MNKSELLARCEAANLTCEVIGGSVGHFKDLCIGLGADILALSVFGKQLRQAGVPFVRTTWVDVKEHPSYGKWYVEVSSFWFTDDAQDLTDLEN